MGADIPPAGTCPAERPKSHIFIENSPPREYFLLSTEKVPPTPDSSEIEGTFLRLGLLFQFL